MDFQIILLPKDNYWDWLNACRTYVQHYGVNLTSDSATAARYMKPRQVVSFPVGATFAEGDLKRWFEVNHDGVRLDPISATTPAELKADLERRVKEQDRYAQKRKPFYLLWPTEYAVITQPFGANPQIYSRFGFPGHEGVDFRARMNTNIYCCADGEVFQVHQNPDDHPYGIHVRVRHALGYRTIYAHFDHVLVHEGERVAAGQILGKADSTGASTGSHLHLTLKQDGATMRGETSYPKDVLDPTPYLVWPEQSMKKALPAENWPAGKCLIGVHGRIGGDFEEQDFEAVRTGRFEAVKLERREPTATLERIAGDHPGMMFFLRLSMDFSRGRISPDDFLQAVAADAGRFYRSGVRFVELNPSPNHEREGWQRSWSNGREYAAWFCAVQERLKKVYPAMQIGFPGLATGGAVPGIQGDMFSFLQEAEPALQAADWIGVHVYWRTEEDRHDLRSGLLHEEMLLHNPDKLLVITECGNPSPDISEDEKSRQLLAFMNAIRRRDGIAAAFAYPLSNIDGIDSFCLRSEQGGLKPAVAALGKRIF